MRLPTLAALAVILLLAGCATHQRQLPAWEPPIPRTEYQHVRTTAYNDGEADHIRYTNHNALGTTLQYGQMNSAAADWSRWPAGTLFRIVQTNQTYVVDDYGWDLAGTNTIDLYKPTKAAMDRWGVQHVDIQILQWGDPGLSYRTLQPRSGYRHIARMLAELKPELNKFPAGNYTMPPNTQPASYVAATAPAAYPAARVATASSRSSSRRISSPSPVVATGAALTPFY